MLHCQCGTRMIINIFFHLLLFIVFVHIRSMSRGAFFCLASSYFQMFIAQYSMLNVRNVVFYTYFLSLHVARIHFPILILLNTIVFVILVTFSSSSFSTLVFSANKFVSCQYFCADIILVHSIESYTVCAPSIY